MKIVKRFKTVVVAGVYVPQTDPVSGTGTSFYLDGSRKWNTAPVRRAQKRAERTAALRQAKSDLSLI